MLNDKDALPIIAVKDLERAKKFYEESLNLKVSDEAEQDVLSCQSGKTKFLIYKSEFAGTNKANALVWNVGRELEDMVSRLKAKGVKFEHYNDMPGVTLKGDIHYGEDMKLAWFKDPDGNILHFYGH